MLSKKHFIAIAKILNSENANYEIINRFADYLGNENPKFDRNKFIEASTLKEVLV